MGFITAMTTVGKQMGAVRIVKGTRLNCPCGEPGSPAKADRDVRQRIVKCALDALQASISGPTIFNPDATQVSG